MLSKEQVKQLNGKTGKVQIIVGALADGTASVICEIKGPSELVGLCLLVGSVKSEQFRKVLTVAAEYSNKPGITDAVRSVCRF